VQASVQVNGTPIARTAATPTNCPQPVALISLWVPETRPGMLTWGFRAGMFGVI
jgi:hypothetical protein